MNLGILISPDASTVANLATHVFFYPDPSDARKETCIKIVETEQLFYISPLVIHGKKADVGRSNLKAVWDTRII
jgi:hypothetical protein